MDDKCAVDDLLAALVAARSVGPDRLTESGAGPVSAITSSMDNEPIRIRSAWSRGTSRRLRIRKRPMPVSGTQQEFQAELVEVRSRLHRGRLGLLVGAVVGLVLSIALAIVLGTEGATVWDLALVVPLGCFGAGLGHVITVGRLESRLHAVVGFGIDADRIRRAVGGEEDDGLSPEQQDRAARYAALLVLVAPARALRWALLVVGILVGQAARLIGSALDAGQPFATLIPAALGVLSAAVLAGLIPSRLRSARRAREYTEAHPWPPAIPRPTSDTAG